MLSGRNIVVGILPVDNHRISLSVNFLWILIVILTQEPPYVKIEKQSGKIMKVEGFVPEIVQWLAEKYNFS